jgi:hypothetical protein
MTVKEIWPASETGQAILAILQLRRRFVLFLIAKLFKKLFI